MTTVRAGRRRLDETSAKLHEALTSGRLRPALFRIDEIKCMTLFVSMRDGVRLATDVYLPPERRGPTVVMRTPYGRSNDGIVGAFLTLARRGYAVVSQDCRGTGDSEPHEWNYYMFEAQDGFDCIEWIRHQDFCDGFIGACGGSYVGQTQWPMALHPAMSTIVPEVSGVGVARNTVHLHMNLTAYSRSVGKGPRKRAVSYGDLEREIITETLGGGFFNEPLRPTYSSRLHALFPNLHTLTDADAQSWLWQRYCSSSGAHRTELVKAAYDAELVSIVEVEHLTRLFGQHVAHDAHSLPRTDPAALAFELRAPALIHTGWYDWALNDALATFKLIKAHARPGVARMTKLIVAPSAHNKPGYVEGIAERPELQHNHRMPNHVELLLRWYDAVRLGETGSWPEVIYYLMGANEWRTAQSWPPAGIAALNLYLHGDGRLTPQPPIAPIASSTYDYDPCDPTPTVGGKVVSSVYPAGSVDASAVQARADVLTFTTEILEADLDVVGSLRLVLFASSSAADTDFSARLTDVFSDGRALFVQSGILRTRYRGIEPQLLEPHEVYAFDIDLWATAHRFKAGHRLRLDICSADFPQFDRNSNCGGVDQPPIRARQTIFHDARRPSRLVLSILTDQAQV